ncbi:MAG: hypothetical protein Q9181_003607 [Wetmoreana brouardii]
MMTANTSTPSAQDTSHTFAAFDGAITTRVIPRPHCAFAFEVTVQNRHPQIISLATQKPPAHFHPYQCEYVEVLEGRIGLEIEGHDRILGPEDGQVKVKPWTNHRLHPPPQEMSKGGAEDAGEITRFMLSGAETAELFKLDTIFFQNWYGYQDEVVMGRGRMDLIQMFDAGGSYLSVPCWVPFGRILSRVLGIMIGRWLGAMLGYQPFYRKWTTDWDSACEKMEASYFQRKFADRAKME